MKQFMLFVFMAIAMVAMSCASESAGNAAAHTDTEDPPAETAAKSQNPNASGSIVYSYKGEDFKIEMDEYFKIYQYKDSHKATGKDFHSLSFSVYGEDGRIIKVKIVHNGLTNRFDGEYPLKPFASSDEFIAFANILFTDNEATFSNTFMLEEGTAKVYMDGKTLKISVAQSQGRLVLNSEKFPVSLAVEAKNFRLSEE